MSELCPCCGDVIGPSQFRRSLLVRPDGSYYSAETARVPEGETIVMGADEVYESVGMANPATAFYIKRPAADRWVSAHSSCYENTQT